VLSAAPFAALSAVAAVPNVRRAVVSVRVSGVRRDNNEPTQTVSGSGFFVNREGYIVTSWHLIRQLGDVNPNLNRFEINTDHTQSWISAIVLEQRPETDILVLKAHMGSRPFDILRRAKNAKDRITIARTPVWTAGFPAGYGYLNDTGVVTSFDGTISPPTATWTTNMTFKGGASGSPIYLEDGSVVAIAKGVDSNATQIGLVVPVNLIPAQYWEDETVAADRPANLEDIAALPRVVITQLVPATMPRSRITPANISYDSCSNTAPRQVEVSATPGWTIAAAPAVIKQHEARGAEFRITLTDQTPDRIRAVVEVSGHACTEPPLLLASIQYTEVPGAGAQEEVQIAESTLFRGVDIPIGLNSLHGVSVAIVTEDGFTTPVPLSSANLIRADGSLIIPSAQLSARVPISRLPNL
jgi:hypothetical protein